MCKTTALSSSPGMQLNQETRAGPARRLTADYLYKNLKILGILTEEYIQQRRNQ